jgi:hypothetical protein|tara:strand:+ start:2359 stop:2517 length:159 start_codon:yes stop_codon:yes gene_type:complete
MLKFTAGLATGWIAARSLNNDKIMPPTIKELTILAEKCVVLYEKAITKIKDQ